MEIYNYILFPLPHEPSSQTPRRAHVPEQRDNCTVLLAHKRSPHLTYLRNQANRKDSSSNPKKRGTHSHRKTSTSRATSSP
ncbi:hypothetical protein BDV36DRAFT_277972 [Aspergillus pseudocaelatus]|uniref:Uncharacterized protein n=1 Tax=Aspergillus pseudocaelatus TaxID=1825620 RepID=A0ABQ6VZQ7_9EURO|nr:hypothetical protein BDV36DRAFT_277972 [Aspergillus pseudocaelatus]